VGNIRLQIEWAKELILRFDTAQEDRQLSPLEAWFRRELKRKYLGLCSLQRTIARQRSRILWLREGEANTKFFHLHTNHRRRKNYIPQIIHNNELLIDQERIEQAFADHYEQLFSAPPDREFTINFHAIGVPTHDLASLDDEFDEEEVWAAIKDLPGDRSPGPDGFTGSFLKACWGTIKVDLMNVFRAVRLGRAHGFAKLNRALITLLPKKQEASSVNDYRPISLVHCVAKLIAKTMSRRLAPVLPTLVSANQSAFIKGRAIHDNFMLVQQLAKSFHRAKAPTVLLKLDIARAFDTVSWPFIIELLQHLGFGQIWINLVCLLLSTASTRILVNSVPGDEIYHHRGVRQGDPLSPMLFVLVMEIFHLIVDFAARLGLLSALPGSRGACRTSLYADDTVVFIKPSISDCATFRDLLQIFGSATGLHTNFLKSSATPIRCSAEERQIIAQHLLCPVKDFPIPYLGVPLSIWKLRAQDLQPLIDNLHGKLAGWRAGLLSKGDRLVLIKSVLASTPIHIMLATDLPTAISEAIIKCQRTFFWANGRSDSGGSCAVAWSDVCRPTDLGGLGVPDIKRMSWALRARWLWLRRSNTEKPWVNFPIQTNKHINALVHAASHIHLGSGETALFWSDRWIDKHCIADIAPEVLIAVKTRAKNTRTVATALPGNAWIQDIVAALSADGIIQFLHLVDILQSTQLSPDTPDTLIWHLTESGDYSSKSAYRALFEGTVTSPHYDAIWTCWAPLKCKIFAWLASLDRCWTNQRRQRHGLTTDDTCALCDQGSESIAHLMVQCSFSQQVWFDICTGLNLQTCMPNQTAEFKDWFATATANARSDSQKGAKSIVILTMWNLWRTRNDAIFNNVSPNRQHVVQTILEEAKSWSLAGASALRRLPLHARPPDLLSDDPSV
jgi:hypothetical protein